MTTIVQNLGAMLEMRKMMMAQAKANADLISRANTSNDETILQMKESTENQINLMNANDVNQANLQKASMLINAKAGERSSQTQMLNDAIGLAKAASKSMGEAAKAP